MKDEDTNSTKLFLKGRVQREELPSSIPFEAEGDQGNLFLLVKGDQPSLCKSIIHEKTPLVNG